VRGFEAERRPKTNLIHSAAASRPMVAMILLIAKCNFTAERVK